MAIRNKKPKPVRVLKPQPGPQEDFLATSADICIYGGAAGGGKTFGLLLSPLRYKNIPGFGCTIFRRNFNQIYAQGGLWDESREIYTGINGATPKYSRGEWWFCDSKGNTNGKISFAHIERDDDLMKWQGSQICGLCFDELTHFSEKTFFYMLSRNRSTCGVKPYVRATCNPDAESWVARFIAWWIDPDTGYAIPERSGKIRWFIRRNEEIHWANTPEELWEEFDLHTPEERGEPKSVTFIASQLKDNAALLEKNPSYLANLKAMSVVERERLLYGNWKIKAAAGLFFKRAQVTMITEAPKDIRMLCRAWDMAASEETKRGDPDYTSGVLIGLRANGTTVVLDVINQRIKAGDVEKLIYNTAIADKAKYGLKCRIRIPQDPGAAGKIVAQSYIKLLSGFPVTAIPVTGSKELRAMPFATQWQNGNVEVLAAEWNEAYFTQLEAFPESKHDDMVDASADAFSEVTSSTFTINSLI